MTSIHSKTRGATSARLNAWGLAALVMVTGVLLVAQRAQAQTPPAPSTPPPAAAAQQPPAASTSAQYRLALGDLIRITVFQVPDLSLETRITEAGSISYPLLGSVSLVGLTVADAEARIAKGLRDGNFVRQPQVSINVIQTRGNQVSVLGQIGRPGRYPLETGEVRLTDMLATAGGIATGGADQIIVVGTRNSQPYRVEVDLPSVFAPNRRSADVLLQNGDVVWVERAPTIYMYGEVQRPGAMRLERNMTVMQALASAGGITNRGTLRGLRISRKDTDGKPREVEPQMNDSLRPDDIVFVRESVF
jgi:polysaccharide biosynthesis/export protein